LDHEGVSRSDSKKIYKCLPAFSKDLETGVSKHLVLGLPEDGMYMYIHMIFEVIIEL
jgi:hypothetical protein